MVDSTVAAQSGGSQIHAALDAAVRGIAGLVSVDEVLQVIVDRVRPLVGAQYAALGIVDADGRIERFVTSGMDDATRRRIGVASLVSWGGAITAGRLLAYTYRRLMAGF